jgi:lipoprotein-releasing system permease protein
MYQPTTFFIGLRYMRGRASDRFARFVSWLSSIGMTLGVMAMIVVLSVMNGFDKEQKNNFLSLMPQAVLSSEAGSITPQNDVRDRLLTLPDVKKVVPLTTGDVVIQSANNIGVAVMLGINPQDNDPLAAHLLYTRIEALEPGQYQAIIGDRLAEQLGIRVGQQIRIMVTSASQLTPMGRIPSQRLFTVIGIFSSGTDADANQILLNQQDASRLMRYPAGNVTGWRLFLDDPVKVEQLSRHPLPDGLLWQDWRARKGELFQAIKMEKNMMSLLMSLIIIVAAFNLITSLSLLVMEKQGEVAILQTLGLRRSKIMSVFMIQGATAGVVGAILGSAAGVLIASQLNNYMPSMAGILLPVDIRTEQVIAIAVATIALSLISTLYPSWRAAAVQPAEALRYE